MNRSFFSVYKAVLAGEPEIPEIPNDKLRAVDDEGEPINYDIPTPFFILIARLQTLCFLVGEESEIPSSETITSIAAALGEAVLQVTANSLATQEDGILRVAMIQRMIVELVRNQFPSECDHLGVEYRAHISFKIIRVPLISRGMLD
ncbi:MAG: hypothetical protein RL094_375 [Candidatus Parcubacteria bacterium]|jgi:hypothetical protein